MHENLDAVSYWLVAIKVFVNADLCELMFLGSKIPKSLE